jgi:hypothetical protein
MQDTQRQGEQFVSHMLSISYNGLIKLSDVITLV